MNNRLFKHKKLIYYFLGFYWFALFVATSYPSGSIIDSFRVSDKIKHFGAYLVLAVLFSLAACIQKKYAKLSENYLRWTIIILSVYGILDEIHQIFIPNRSGEVLDWVADFIGILFGTFIVKMYIRYLSKKELNSN